MTMPRLRARSMLAPLAWVAPLVLLLSMLPSMPPSVLPGALSLAATPAPEAPPPLGPGSLAGQLLIASPGITDPRFAHTVIYMVRHDKDGALGLIVNRLVGERPMADLLKAIDQDATGVAGTIRIFAGGPVQPEVGFVLHSADYHDAHTMAVDGRFAVTSSPGILRDIATGKGPKQSMVAFGYTGWAPGQLESEMMRHDWLVAPADAALLFDQDRDGVWQRAMDRRTLDL
jgi:putative transcriptional regulator